MNRKWALIAIIMVFLAGCITTGNEFKFPSDISSMCYGAKNESKSRIQSKGVSLKEKSGCSVIKQPGEKKFSGMWGWQSPEWNGIWVLGLCGGNWIKVGCNPSTFGEVNGDILIHEFGHYWLMTNYDDYTHNPKYADLFYNWREPRSIVIDAISAPKELRRIYDTLQEGETFSAVIRQADKTVLHVDFIKGPLDKSP